MTWYDYPWVTQHLGTLPDASEQVYTPWGPHGDLPSPRWADGRHDALVGVHTLYNLYIHRGLSQRRVAALQLYSLYSML